MSNTKLKVVCPFWVKILKFIKLVNKINVFLKFTKKLFFFVFLIFYINSNTNLKFSNTIVIFLIVLEFFKIEKFQKS